MSVKVLVSDEHVPVRTLVCHHMRKAIAPVFHGDAFVNIGAGGLSAHGIDFTDDTGDNVSVYNKHINEASAFYWAAAHLDLNSDYVATAHYRRLLSYDSSMLGPDIIGAPFGIVEPVTDQYSRAHGFELLALFERMLSCVDPALGRAFTYYMDSYNKLFLCTMFVMSAARFEAWSRHMRLFVHLLVSAIESGDRSAVAGRAAGYLLERLSSFELWYQLTYSGAKWVDTPIIDPFSVTVQ